MAHAHHQVITWNLKWFSLGIIKDRFICKKLYAFNQTLKLDQQLENTIQTTPGLITRPESTTQHNKPLKLSQL